MTAAVGALRRWRWRVAIVAVVIVALVVVIATRGSAATEGNYRTAAVETGDVTQSLTATGSIESASRSDVAFQVDGTVEDVAVAVGDTVEAGQVLATLDDSDLDDAVSKAEDALTEAEDTLSDNLDAQSTGTAVSSSTGSGSSNTMSDAAYTTGTRVVALAAFVAADAPAPDLGSAKQAVRDAQQALLDQYDVAQAALQNAKGASAAATAACAAFTDISGDGTATADDIAAALAACQDATTDAMSAQQDSADAQSALMDAANALNSAVDALLQAVEVSGGSGGSGSGGSGGSGGSATDNPGTGGSSSGSSQGNSGSQGGAASGGQGQTGSVPTAADILANRAAVTAAQATLAVAQAQLDYASLESPVAGKVVSVGFAAGGDVTGGDTATAITVIADNSYLVNLSVSLTQARLLAVGQAAELTLLSDNKVVDGTVASVGTVNAGNSFSQSYAVTIAVPDPGFDIRIGTATRMAITVAAAKGVLVVPTSAVSDATGAATVQVVGDDGTAKSVSVNTGAVGPEYTEIATGLDKGQQVILADLSLKLSTGDDDSSSTGGLLSGLGDDDSDQPQQFPGGGNFQPPDGFPGGGFRGGQNG